MHDSNFTLGTNIKTNEEVAIKLVSAHNLKEPVRTKHP